MKLRVEKPGALTTVQDLGRWGYQAMGMPVSGTMDAAALQRGNTMMGNPLGSAALEITLMGPTLTVVEGEGAAVITGADLSPALNGVPCANWTVLHLKEGDVLSFGAPWWGLRAYLCLAGGIEVPVVMGSRCTYMKTATGGFQGRALKAGDMLNTGEPWILWRNTLDFTCPAQLKPAYDPERPLNIVLGLQSDAFTPQGIETLLNESYEVSPSADRMGYRLEGPEIEHIGKPDIISDGIPMGAVQVPGNGKPIVLMADRQTTGGYTKIGVICAFDVARLAQRLPGAPVRFAAITQEDGVALARAEAAAIAELRQHLYSWTARPASGGKALSSSSNGTMNLSVNGKTWQIQWERQN